MATGKQESIICSLAYHLSLHLWQQNLSLLDFTPDFAKDFDYLQEVKIFYSGDGHTGMGWEKVGTWLWFFFPVLQYHHVVCPREGNKLCFLPDHLKDGQAYMVFPSRVISFLETSRSEILSRPPLWAAQFCCVPKLGLAVPHQKSGFLTLAKWVWDFYCSFVAWLNEFWAVMVLVVSFNDTPNHL